jgi:hypothetical protein
MSTQSSSGFQTPRDTSETHRFPEQDPTDNGRNAVADLLWWVTPSEFDLLVEDELTLRQLGTVAVDRADRRGERISPDLRDDEWYEQYLETGRVQR